MTDLTYYKSALAGKPLPISADHPQAGYYRVRRGKDKPYEPVVIYPKDGEMLCKVGHEFVEWTEVWNWCADKPVTKDDYRVAFETGSWPGDVEVSAAIGDNSGDVSLMDEVADYMETARSWGKGIDQKAVDKTIADMAANYASQLGTLAGKLDKERKEKIAPHLEAQREVNGIYNPIIEEAKSLVKSLKQITGVWLRAEDEKRRKELAATSIAQEEVERVKAGGQRGRRVGLRTVIKYEAEAEEQVLAWALAERHEDMLRRAIDLAEAAMKGGASVPGMKRIETKEAV